MQQVIANLPARTLPYFYRTKDGSELDLVLVKGNSPALTIEIKFSNSPVLSKGNYLAIADVNAPLNLVVTPSGGDYPLDKHVRVCNLENVWKYIR